MGVWGCLVHCSYAILCHQPHLEFCKTKSIMYSESTSVSSLHLPSEPVLLLSVYKALPIPSLTVILTGTYRDWKDNLFSQDIT